MRSQLNITARKLLSFYEDPLNQIVTAKDNADNDYDSRLWHSIFLHFFYCGPVDPENKPVRAGQPLGSNDPRWDTLLIEGRGLQARKVVLRLLKMRQHSLASKQNMKAA